MIITETFKDDFFECFYGVRPCVGQILSGDEIVLCRQADYIVVGVIDGLGHGKKASEVAINIKDYIQEHHFLPLDTLLSQAHELFKGSQGAVVALAKIFADGQAQYIGLGNIETRLLSSQRSLILLPRDGALGIRSRRIEMTLWQMQANEILLFYSDGISNQIMKEGNLPFIRSTADIQRNIEIFGKSHDDAALFYIHKLTPPIHYA